jgi:two-component system OmpR family response regulator
VAHILLVEDDEKLSKVMKRALGEEGHVVDLAADGPSGLGLGRMDGFQLIILDVMLPGLDGFQVCRSLRDEGSQTPVLMLTARESVEDRVRGLDAGADDYLVKPFALAELLARIRALTRRGVEGNGQEQRVGDLVLDVARHCAVRGEREIPLTVKEFQLLEYFMRHPNQVLSRTQILEGVWQYDRQFASNVVDTYVHYLRRKIDKNARGELIRTVRGAGYMLKA